MGNSEKESLENRIEHEIIVRREAQLEVQEAFRYYQEISEGLGFEFMRSLDAALQSVKRNPSAYQKIYKETRRALLRKFPYAVFLYSRRKSHYRDCLLSSKTKRN